jgi:hypothetical protein
VDQLRVQELSRSRELHQHRGGGLCNIKRKGVWGAGG